MYCDSLPLSFGGTHLPQRHRRRRRLLAADALLLQVTVRAVGAHGAAHALVEGVAKRVACHGAAVGSRQPSAALTASIAAAATQLSGDVVPLYGRPPDAILPDLPPNPLGTNS